MNTGIFVLLGLPRAIDAKRIQSIQIVENVGERRGRKHAFAPTFNENHVGSFDARDRCGGKVAEPRT